MSPKALIITLTITCSLSKKSWNKMVFQPQLFPGIIPRSLKLVQVSESNLFGIFWAQWMNQSLMEKIRNIFVFLPQQTSLSKTSFFSRKLTIVFFFRLSVTPSCQSIVFFQRSWKILTALVTLSSVSHFQEPILETTLTQRSKFTLEINLAIMSSLYEAFWKGQCE